MDRSVCSFGYRTQAFGAADEFLASTAPDQAALRHALTTRAAQRDPLEETEMANESVVPRQFHLLSFEGPDLALRRSALRTARQYTWHRVLERHLLPCIGAFGGIALDALRVA